VQIEQVLERVQVLEPGLELERVQVLERVLEPGPEQASPDWVSVSVPERDTDSFRQMLFRLDNTSYSQRSTFLENTSGATLDPEKDIDSFRQTSFRLGNTYRFRRNTFLENTSEPVELVFSLWRVRAQQ
jgi:hypothetical protein